MEYLNFILYCSFAIIAFKNKYSLLVKFVALLWSLCAFIGIFYYHSDAYKQGLQPLSLFPIFFLFGCWCLNILPLRKSSMLKIDTQMLFHRNVFVRIILYVITITAIPLFIELSYVLIQAIFTGRIFLMAENYDDIANGYSDRMFSLSSISDVCLHISFYFQVLSPLLLLLYINYEEKKKFIAFGLFASSLTVPLYTICSGSRTGIVFFSLYFLFLYLFLYKIYKDSINKKLKKLLLWSGGLLLFILTVLSVGRFVLGSNYDDNELGNSLYIYTSESMYNFNTMASQTNRNTYGNYAFMPSMIRLGLGPVNDLSKRRDYLNKNMDISRIWFYTYIGDFCIDFGYVGSLLIVIFMSLLINNILKRKIYLPGLCLIAVYIYITSCGIFYYPFQAGDSPLVGCLIFALLFKFSNILYWKND